MRILGVHGIGNHLPGLTSDQASACLARKWSVALADGLSALRSTSSYDMRCVYYADRLRIPVPQTRADELGPLPAGGDELIRLWAAELGVEDAIPMQGRATVPIRILVDHMVERSEFGSAVVRRVVGTFIREVNAYLHDPTSPAREESRQAVVAAMRRYRPDVVVAHSLGSVVTYEALWAAPDVHVGLLVTLGSPLGMNGVVYQRLVPQQEQAMGQRPPNIAKWVNIADIGDFVAVPRPFTKRFTPDEQKEIEIRSFGFHSVRSYLAAKFTVETLMHR